MDLYMKLDKMDIKNTKISSIESKLEAIIWHFGEENVEFKKRLEEVLLLVKEEKQIISDLKDIAQVLANRL